MRSKTAAGQTLGQEVAWVHKAVVAQGRRFLRAPYASASGGAIERHPFTIVRKRARAHKGAAAFPRLARHLARAAHGIRGKLENKVRATLMQVENAMLRKGRHSSLPSVQGRARNTWCWHSWWFIVTIFFLDSLSIWLFLYWYNYIDVIHTRVPQVETAAGPLVSFLRID